jgi:hypothetical protein
MSGIAINILSPYESGFLKAKNFLQESNISLNFLVFRNEKEKLAVNSMREGLKSADWDYKLFCKENKCKFNEQLSIFAKKEEKSINDYLYELFESDYSNKPFIYDGQIVQKNGKFYYPVYTVWAADINSCTGLNQLGDVEQIVIEFKKQENELIPCRIARKSHYYPNSSKIKGSELWQAFNCGNHYPYPVVKKKEYSKNLIKSNGKYFMAGNAKNEEIHYSAFDNVRATFNKKDFKCERIEKKISHVGKKVSIPFFEKKWSYVNPELMFSLKGKIFGCIDALVYTF